MIGNAGSITAPPNARIRYPDRSARTPQPAVPAIFIPYGAVSGRKDAPYGRNVVILQPAGHCGHMKNRQDMEYKKKYTREEIGALADWYRRHWQELPDTLQLDTATRFLRLRQTIQSLFAVYDLHGEHKAFGGHIYQLWKIQRKLQEQGIGNE